MIKHLATANRRRVPVKYAVMAAGVAVVGVLAIETAGSALTTSYSGLGGRLTPATDGAAAVIPARAPSSSDLQ